MADLRNIAVLPSLPKCDFCDQEALYDFKTNHGPWAYGCEVHWQAYRAVSRLGLGIGQLLVTEAALDPGRLLVEEET